MRALHTITTNLDAVRKALKSIAPIRAACEDGTVAVSLHVGSKRTDSSENDGNVTSEALNTYLSTVLKAAMPDMLDDVAGTLRKREAALAEELILASVHIAKVTTDG